MATPKDSKACLVVHVTRPSGCNEPRLDAYLGERTDERTPSEGGHEYPRSPDEVNGFACHHGSLGIYAWTYQGRVGSWQLEYERLAYVDADKLAACSKTLGKLTRAFSKMADTRGYAASWADAVARFAEATGALSIAFDATAIGRIDHVEERSVRDLRGAKFVFVALRDAPRMLRSLEASFGTDLAIVSGSKVA